MRRLHEKGPSESPKGLSPGPSAGPFSPEKKSCVLYLSTCLADPRISTMSHSVLLPLGLLLGLALLLCLLRLFLRHVYLLLENEKRSLTVPSPRRESPPLRLHNHAEYRSGPGSESREDRRFGKIF